MELALWEIGVLILAGLAGGFINVMAGGGSVITVPVMNFNQNTLMGLIALFLQSHEF